MPSSNDNNSDTVAIPRKSTPKTGSDGNTTRVLANRYHIERTIGTGGMGEIYLAMDSKLQRQVAIKMMLHPEDDSDNKRFELESQAVASFSDPHTIRLFDYGITEEGHQYQVIEYLEGNNIKEHLRSHGPLHPTIAKSVAIQLCGSLSEAHRKNILHRDIKPSNIMLIDSPERGVQCKLLDFGLARSDNHDPTITKTGTVLGSPMYMSPEQIESKSDELTPQTDVYSLGLTLYTMVTGKQPFSGSSLSSILASQLFHSPTPLIEVQPSLSIEPALCWTIETAIQKKPIDRFISVSQMKKAIELALQNPEATLILRDEELFCDDEFIQSYTSLSLQDISLAVDSMQSEQRDTINQHVVKAKGNHNSPRSSLLILGGLAMIGLFVGLFMSEQNNTEITIQPTVTSSARSNQLAIDVQSSPAGASIFVGTQYMGTTPTILELSQQSDVVLQLKKEGFEDQILDWPKSSGTMNIVLQPIEQRSDAVISPISPIPKNPITPKSEQNKPKNSTSSEKGVKEVTNPFE
jgi:serine/threonine protein kinase